MMHFISSYLGESCVSFFFFLLLPSSTEKQVFKMVQQVNLSKQDCHKHHDKHLLNNQPAPAL